MWAVAGDFKNVDGILGDTEPNPESKPSFSCIFCCTFLHQMICCPVFKSADGDQTLVWSKHPVMDTSHWEYIFKPHRCGSYYPQLKQHNLVNSPSENKSQLKTEHFMKTLDVIHRESQTFEPDDLYPGENFGKVLSTLTALNKATEERSSGRKCSFSSSQHHSNTATSQQNSNPSDPSHSKATRLSKNMEMPENGTHQLVVKARFNFRQNNEDELSFKKGDILYVTRVEEGGWWEGTLNGKTGWFPSNYVREVKSDKPLSPKILKPSEGSSLTKNYYSVVLQNIIETEQEYAKELHTLIGTYLRPLQSSDKLSPADVSSLLGNIEEIGTFQQSLCQALDDCAKLPESQQRVGSCFLNLVHQMKSLYSSYCANHPSAVAVLTQHGDELDKYMESLGATSPGILILTTNLSKPFMRLDKYSNLLQELERHMEQSHPDHADVLKAVTTFKALATHCQELRKRKQLELQILSEPIQGWEGEDIRTIGNVLYMSQVMVQCSANEDKEERYFLLFSSVLVMLSASPRMSGFIYQGKLPITGMTVTKLEESEPNHFSFEITGNMIERILVSCSNSQDLNEWFEHLHRLTKGTSSTSLKGRSGSTYSHSDSKASSGLSSHHPFSQSFSGTGQSRGPLEPPKIPKPWTLSCLRPAPPLRPSAALGHREDSSKSPKTVKKFLSKRKPERKPSDDDYVIRKSTAAFEEDAQILKVIEAYCTGASIQQSLGSSSRKDSAPQVLLPEEEKLIIEESSNGHTIIEEKSLVDTVYALRDEVKELKQENKRMKQCLEEEQKSRKELEKLVRKLLKQTNDPTWDETSH
ncbi:rho guanine nucleotide exchange factor 6 isoform X2 [Protopterus annectens]|uniref:rho guanine nucleotide exchange factor 6 isoform X2 n=1 Tax=Protopterus annectens TaxID=7888 RepID=UPI001CFB5578|nr:rho guanine nucleotide exchange factor 6 isoform X2 [Protopterus annectens]